MCDHIIFTDICGFEAAHYPEGKGAEYFQINQVEQTNYKTSWFMSNQFQLGLSS